MTLHVVVDTKGGGRVLAVVESRSEADELCAISPLYYKAHRAELNRINPECLEWVDSEEQGARLRALIERMNGG